MKYWFVLAMLFAPSVGNWARLSAAESNPRASIDFYLQTYGQVAPAELRDVYAVFDKVRATADRSSMVTPTLVVVRDAKQALAFTLSDGTIVLSSKALDVLRSSASTAEAQARIAFVLGHELAHLAANDFWDSQVAQALTSASQLGAGTGELPRIELRALNDDAANQQKKEL
jgi:Zn-dependent protease with chaperone function